MIARSSKSSLERWKGLSKKRAETLPHAALVLEGRIDRLGLKRIDRWVSMSDLKYNAVIDAGIEIVEQVALPAGLVPERAHVEISAKQHAGYFSAAAG